MSKQLFHFLLREFLLGSCFYPIYTFIRFYVLHHIVAIIYQVFIVIEVPVYLFYICFIYSEKYDFLTSLQMETLKPGREKVQLWSLPFYFVINIKIIESSTSVNFVQWLD